MIDDDFTKLLQLNENTENKQAGRFGISFPKPHWQMIPRNWKK